MSYNIRIGCGHDDPFHLQNGALGHLPRCAEVIRSARPDVVGIQEIDRNTDRAGKVDQTAVLADLCGLEGSFVRKVDRPGGDYGLAELSRRRPLRVEKILMPGSRHTRALMICEYDDYVVANTHFPLAEWARTNAAAVVRRSLSDFAERKPVFLLGDFNSTPDSRTMRAIKEDFRVLSDESRPTFPAKDLRRTIDYILVDRRHADGIRVVGRELVVDSSATDHAALVVDVELSENGVMDKEERK